MSDLESSSRKSEGLPAKPVIAFCSGETLLASALPLLESNGVRVLALPAIAIQPPVQWNEVDTALKNLETFNYIIFTSANAVRQVVQRWKDCMNSVWPQQPEIVAIGTSTERACSAAGLRVKIVPQESSARGLVREIRRTLPSQESTSFLVPRSSIAREELVQGLQEAGYKVTAPVAYRTTTPDVKSVRTYIQAIKDNAPDAFAFTSPSTYSNTKILLGVANPIEYFKGKCLASIGPTTTEAIRSDDLSVTIEADEPSAKSLTDSIINYYRQS